MIEPDPVVQWKIASLGPKKTAKITYSVASLESDEITGDNFKEFHDDIDHPEVRIGLQLGCTQDSQCNDQNNCTIDSCIQAKCMHEKSNEPACQQSTPPADNTLIIMLVGLLALILMAAFLVKNKFKEKPENNS